MTTPSPLSVKYRYDADYWTPAGWVALPVVLIDPSADRDRTSYAAATMELAPVTEDVITALDPRHGDPYDGGQVRWRITQLDLAGNVIGWMPRIGNLPGAYARMYVRRMRRTLDGVTLDLQGAETMINDRLNLEPEPMFFPARSETDLIGSVLCAVFNDDTFAAADAAASDFLALPFTFRDTTLASGASYIDLMATELSSRGLRFLDRWGLGLCIADRETPPTWTGAPAVVKLASYTSETLPADVDPIITGIEEVFDRDTGYADGVGVASDLPLAGNTKWQSVAAPPRHTKGRMIDVALKSEPTANYALSVLARALRRGHDLTVTARARLDVLPGMQLEVHLVGGTLTAQIASVSWDLANGLMTLRAQSAVGAPPDVATTSNLTTTMTAREAFDGALSAVRAATPPPPDRFRAAWEQAQIATF